MRLSKQLLICIAGILVLASGSSYALPLAFDDSFWEIRGNSGSDYWAVIGNPGNVADTRYIVAGSNPGSVAYTYSIGKYEVTNALYLAFLNAVATTSDPYSLYNSSMKSISHAGITRTAIFGTQTYTYSLKTHVDDTDTYKFYENKPVVFVNFYDILRFINWLQNGQPTGVQDATTTEEGVYKLTGLRTVDNTYYDGALRNPDAAYWLPSDDEWYKAAYYDPTTGLYYEYPTGSNTAPTAEVPPGSTNNGENSANYDNAVGTVTDVGEYDNSCSPYGTYDQGGNVMERTERLVTGALYNIFRGGAWEAPEENISASRIDYLADTIERYYLGFRIASAYNVVEEVEEFDVIPEPVTVGLLAAGLVGLAVRIKKSV